MDTIMIIIIADDDSVDGDGDGDGDDDVDEDKQKEMATIYPFGNATQESNELKPKSRGKANNKLLTV